MIIETCCELISFMEGFNGIRYFLHVDPLNSYFGSQYFRSKTIPLMKASASLSFSLTLECKWQILE